MKRVRVSRWVFPSVLAVLAGLAVAACGDTGTVIESGTPQATNAAAAATPMVRPATAATPASPAASSNAGASDSDPMDGATVDALIEEGKAVYFNGGELGPPCQVCHGQDAMGLIGPPIVGKTADIIYLQFDINLSMQDVVLSDRQVEAVAAYLQSLGPPVAPTPKAQ